MTKKPAPTASLKTRTILLVLGTLLLSLWILAFIGGRMLRSDMQEMLSDQQFSTATVVASQIDLEVSERILALNRVSEAVTAKMLADPAALQSHVEMQPIFRDSFNAGVFATGADGVVVAAYPYTGQIGVSIIDRDYISTVLKEGMPSVGRPIISRKLAFPVFVMAVPIRDGDGRVVGVMAGVTNLNKPNFLSHVTGNGYGKSGGYVVVAAKSRLIVTSSDKRKILQTLPDPGLNPTIDRLVGGYEGSLVMNDSQGTEVLASAKAVPMAGWYLVATLPTSEVFGPFFKLQRNMWLVTIALTIAAGFFTAWLLRGLLAPMLTTVAQLAQMSTGRTPLQPLPMKGPVEIDRLVAGFNQLIGTLKQREDDLIRSAAFSQGILNSIPAEIAVLDRHGVIIGVNRPYHHRCCDTERCNACRPSEVGRNYLNSGLAGGVGLTDVSHDVLGGIRAVLNGELQNLTVEYPCQLAGASAWYSMSVTPLSRRDGGVVVSHTDITERRQAQESIREAKQFQESVIAGVQEGIVVYGLDLRYQLWNSFMEQFIGLSASEVLGRHPLELFPFLKENGVIQNLTQALGGQAGDAVEYQFTVPNRQRSGWAVHTCSPLRDSNGNIIGVIASIIDITARKQAHLALEATVREKEALFKEVHHRVKNNLQVINSLLRLESGRSARADTRHVLIEMQGRIRSMAILHESLYRSKSLAAIELGSYLGELATQACRAMANTAGEINLKMELATVSVGIDQALPCGLIVNELISNSFKHGFPNGANGVILMELATLAGGSLVRLSVSDTGVGLPSDFQVEQCDSLGLHLVSDLAEQLDGQLEFATGPGGRISVTYPVNDFLLS
jgi:PAS domain S-box-containing protein